ncbi:MAG: hypothetical protein LBF59_03755 [Prevotellaceae bacterium]|jgi:hypothetical protein|nr:hypothetical protein [Prevotellaceae bacterium]
MPYSTTPSATTALSDVEDARRRKILRLLDDVFDDVFDDVLDDTIIYEDTTIAYTGLKPPCVLTAQLSS